MRSEADPGGILPSCSRGTSAQAEGISIGNVWISQIHSLRQQDSPRLLHARHLQSRKAPYFRGGPQEPDLISLLETNPWEVSPKGFETGFQASIQASCSWKEHPSRANHPKG